MEEDEATTPVANTTATATPAVQAGTESPTATAPVSVTETVGTLLLLLLLRNWVISCLVIMVKSV